VTEQTRDRILAVALELFEAHGYHGTSVQAIADRVGVTKAAVLYHYPSKYDILAGLAEPLLLDLEAAVTTPGRAGVVGGVLDALITHRYLLRLNLHDLALSSPGPIFERFRDAMLTANTVVAGPSPTLAERVRASQVIACLSDPVVLFADAPANALRAEVMRGVRRLLDTGERDLEAEPAARQTARGRPSAMTPEMIDTARRMHAAGDSAADIATVLGVSRATLYRHLRTSQ
jgi:AcrR family transcriptional regulator